METVNTNDKGVKFVVSLAGASDKNADSRFMIEQNHSPAILVEDGLSTLLPTLEITLHASFCVQDMLERRVTDSGVWVRDSQLGEWKQVPTVQIYVLGYPCTPWSLWHAWKQVNHFTQIVDDFVKVVGSFFFVDAFINIYHIICFEFAFRWCLCPYLFHHLGEARGKASKIQQQNRCSQASRHCVSRSPSCGFSNASKPWQLAVRNQQEQPWLMARRLSMIWRQARFLCDLLLRHYGL